MTRSLVAFFICRLCIVAVAVSAGFFGNVSAQPLEVSLEVKTQVYPGVRPIDPIVTANEVENFPLSEGARIVSPDTGNSILKLTGALSPIELVNVQISASSPIGSSTFESKSTSVLVAVVPRLGDRFEILATLVPSDSPTDAEIGKHLWNNVTISGVLDYDTLVETYILARVAADSVVTAKPDGKLNVTDYRILFQYLRVVEALGSHEANLVLPSMDEIRSVTRRLSRDSSHWSSMEQKLGQNSGSIKAAIDNSFGVWTRSIGLEFEEWKSSSELGCAEKLGNYEWLIEFLENGFDQSELKAITRNQSFAIDNIEREIHNLGCTTETS